MKPKPIKVIKPAPKSERPKPVPQRDGLAKYAAGIKLIGG